MLLFIIIFFAVIIAVSVAAVAGVSIYRTRRRQSLLAAAANQKQFNEPPEGYRSLFAPSDEEIRALEREEQVETAARRQESERQIAFEKAETVREFEKIWRNEPNRSNTIELLRLAAISESAEIFSQTAESVIQVTHHEPTGRLSKKDLADLLDSHLRILPQQERLSGAIFWVKREIKNLRGKSESKSSEF